MFSGPILSENNSRSRNNRRLEQEKQEKQVSNAIYKKVMKDALIPFYGEDGNEEDRYIQQQREMFVASLLGINDKDRQTLHLSEINRSTCGSNGGSFVTSDKRFIMVNCYHGDFLDTYYYIVSTDPNENISERVQNSNYYTRVSVYPIDRVADDDLVFYTDEVTGRIYINYNGGAGIYLYDDTHSESDQKRQLDFEQFDTTATISVDSDTLQAATNNLPSNHFINDLFNYLRYRSSSATISEVKIIDDEYIYIKQSGTYPDMMMVNYKPIHYVDHLTIFNQWRYFGRYLYPVFKLSNTTADVAWLDIYSPCRVSGQISWLYDGKSPKDEEGFVVVDTRFTVLDNTLLPENIQKIAITRVSDNSESICFISIPIPPKFSNEDIITIHRDKIF